MQMKKLRMKKKLLRDIFIATIFYQPLTRIIYWYSCLNIRNTQTHNQKEHKKYMPIYKCTKCSGKI